MNVVQLGPDDDLEAVLRLIQKAFAEQKGLIDPPSSMTTLSVLDISKHLETEMIWGVYDGAKLVACLFGADKGDALYLSKLSVDPAARGQGLAGALMDAAEDFSRKAEITTLEVIARVELTQNHAMFERLGYVKFKEGRHQGYTRTTEIHFRKQVSTGGSL